MDGKKKKGKKVLFVDLPNIVSGGGEKPNFYELFQHLREEFDEVRTYAYIPPESQDDKWGLLRVLVNAGALPIFCPSGDVDPIIVDEIWRALEEKKNIEEIGILSADNGFFRVLESAKRRGIKVKVISPKSGSKLLNCVADEVAGMDEYARAFVPEPAWIDGIGSDKKPYEVERQAAGVMCK